MYIITHSIKLYCKDLLSTRTMKYSNEFKTHFKIIYNKILFFNVITPNCFML